MCVMLCLIGKRLSMPIRFLLGIMSSFWQLVLERPRLRFGFNSWVVTAAEPNGRSYLDQPRN